MDFSKVDWLHVAGWTAVAAVLGPVALGAAGLTAGLAAVGVTMTGAAMGLGAGTVSAVSQAKAAAVATK